MVVIKSTVVNTKFTINKNKVIKVIYPRNINNKYTKNQIEKLVEKYQKKIKGDYKMMLSVDIPNRGFRSGRAFGSEDHLEFPDDYDFETTQQFCLYYYKD
jgi:ribosomal protein S17E